MWFRAGNAALVMATSNTSGARNVIASSKSMRLARATTAALRRADLIVAADVEVRITAAT